MKAIVYQSKKLNFLDVDQPVPSSDEVLVKVESVSINAADYRSMKMGMVAKNKILGSAIAGTVEAVGQGVHNFIAGDEVIGDLSDYGFGGLAEYAAVPKKGLAGKPVSLSFEQAAALPVAATTALKALRDVGNLQKGQKVLIVGASGGVGTYAIQLAKYYGAVVTAVCSTKNLEQSSSLGADHIIDYTKDDFIKTDERYDLIVAINGNYSVLGYKRLLNPNGIYAMVGGGIPQIVRSIAFGWLLSFGKKKMRLVSGKSDPKDLEFVAKLVLEQKIQSVIEREYSFEKSAEAMQYLSDGHAKGKVIISFK